MHNRHRKSKKKVLIFLLVVLIFLIIENIIISKRVINRKQILSLESDARYIDLNKPLLPSKLYDKINCKLSSKYHNVNTHLCIYDNIESDSASKAILTNGIFEPDLLSKKK